ncbi:MAG: YlxR family protein [Clostridia bacterium]|nr:YlxR family protein [Clostridia bacterium]
MVRVRKVPERTCLGCRKVQGKRQMLRLVRTPDGQVVWDPSGRRAGRGAYVCPETQCVEVALRPRVLERALRTTVGPEEVARLRQEVMTWLEG